MREDYEHSVSILQELVEQDPSYIEPHWFLGLALIRTDQLEQGVAELEQGSVFGLKWTKNIEYLIDQYAALEQYTKIVPLYEQLIKRQPDNAQYYARLAATYVALGDKERALWAIDHAVSRDSSLMDEARLFVEEHNLFLDN